MTTVERVFWSLAWIGLIAFGLVSAYALFVGVTFGGALFNPDNLTPTWRWFGVVVAPLPIAFALKWRRNSPPLLILSVVAAFALLGPYVVAVLNR